MHHPARLDGRSAVVLRQSRWGFRVVQSGILSFDGETLWFGRGESRRVFSDAERDSLLSVAAGNRIPECQGFDLFLIAEAGDSSDV